MAHFLRWRDIIAAVPRVDDPDALVKAKADPALAAAMDMCRPPNWHGTGASHDLLAAAQAEGLPLAWVPPPDIIERLRSADSAESREAVLLDERAVILNACATAVDECRAVEIRPFRVLVEKSIAALRDGHHEAAMALAVSVGEGLAHWAVEPRVKAFDSTDDQEQWRIKWNKLQKHSRYRLIELVRIEAKDVEPWDFVHQVLVAPIPHFFTPFYPGNPMPSVFSRHAVAHQPSPDHMSPLNAIKSVMLVTGILRSQQGWIEDVGESD